MKTKTKTKKKTKKVVVTIVKLGGRAITDKSTRETLDEAALEKCAVLLRDAFLRAKTRKMMSSNDSSSSSSSSPALDDDDDFDDDGKEERQEEEVMIAIHGAGSFGHMDAKECGLGEKERKTMMKMKSKAFEDGCAKTRASVQKLNAIVTERLEKDNEITVLRRHVGDAWRFNEKGEVEIDNGRVGVREYCEEQCSSSASSTSTPSLLLLHGDVVEDAAHGRSILSGDRIALEVAKAYAMESTRKNEPVVIRVVFITGARGVFNRDPFDDDDDDDDDEKNAKTPCKLLRKIETTTDGEWICVKDNLKSDIEDIAYATNDRLRYNARLSKKKRGNNTVSKRKEGQISATTDSHDVTGGILGKIQSAVAIANLSSQNPKANVQVYITSVHSPDDQNNDDDVVAALSGSVDIDALVDTRTAKPWRGTVIVREDAGGEPQKRKEE